MATWLLLLTALTAQDDEPLFRELRACASLLPKIRSDDPVDREEARKEIFVRFSGSRDALRRIAKDSAENADTAWIILGLMGDNTARSHLVSLFDAPHTGTRLAALEAYGWLEPKGAPKAIVSLLESPEIPLLFAAARACARQKAPRDVLRAVDKARIDGDKVRLAAALYAAQILQPDAGVKDVVALLDTTEPKSFRAALVAVLNLPGALEELQKQTDVPTMRRAPKLREKLEKGDVDKETRALLGLVLFRSSSIGLPDVVDGLRWTTAPGFPEWAEAMALRTDPWRRSVVIESLLVQWDAAKSAESSATKKLEVLFEKLTRFRGTGATCAERVTSCRDWWARNRISTLGPDINRAIDEGVAWLKREQQPDGTWRYCSCGFPTFADRQHVIGTTALTAYTLLKCEVPPDDPCVAAALKVLIDTPLEKITDHAQTYTVSLIAIALYEALEAKKPKKKDPRRTVTEDRAFHVVALRRIEECAKWLADAQIRRTVGGYDWGSWTYSKMIGNLQVGDNSNTQFAILGLLAARNYGVKIPLEVWQRAFNHWNGTQTESGGWPYNLQEVPGQKPFATNSMTGAGIASFLVCKAALRAIETKKAAEKERVTDHAIEYFSKNYPVPLPHRNTNIGHVFSTYYDLYSLERAMMLGGYETLGGHDWYHDGAMFIVYNQLWDGSWLDNTDTCFALLFLKKAYIAVATGSGR